MYSDDDGIIFGISEIIYVTDIDRHIILSSDKISVNKKKKLFFLNLNFRH